MYRLPPSLYDGCMDKIFNFIFQDTFRMSGAKGHRHVFLFEKGIIIAKKKEDGTLNCKASILVGCPFANFY